MAVRVSIPLPGPFSVSTSSRPGRRTVWHHPGCATAHPTQQSADEHHARLAARTPAQVRRANIGGLIVGWSLAAAVAAGIIAGLVHLAAGLQ
ncbi:hypothetical protein [Curtobacterium sp. MCBA15_012]|uniref:hypothetical protein n=1 Tax=Curtobacterium sp. MCBA15_012 TaxID=1898738 RepID=UPI0008DE7949|nr:hypothetical protein [Curtobacterium sp. MCBA15_012]WIA99761.1 hypothetical protein QOL15_14800 [Curtobacterium sp. MCBA15_012]